MIIKLVDTMLSSSGGGLEQARYIVEGSSLGLVKLSAKHFSNIIVQFGGKTFSPHFFVVSVFPNHFSESAAPFLGSFGSM